MRVYFNNLGVVVNHDFYGDNLRQGSVGNQLKAFFDGVANSDYMATLNFTRSDGSAVAGVIMSYDEAVSNCYKYNFDDPWFFAKAGLTTLTIYLRNRDGSIKAQGQVTFNIEKTDYIDDPQITTSQYNSLLTELVKVEDLLNQGRFPSFWDASAGEPTTEPVESPYTYKRGDYFRVSVSGNKIPTGTQYVSGETNYEESVTPVSYGDVFYFNGTSWEYRSGAVLDVKFFGVSIVESGVARITQELILNALYPVGSVYTSVSEDETTKNLVGKYGCPIANIGGTWERVQGKFLLGAAADDSNQTELTIKMGYYRSANGYYYWEASDGARRSITPGSENYDESNGESRHILTENEMPTHNHDAYLRYTGNQTVDLTDAVSTESGGSFRAVAVGQSWGNLSIAVGNKGGGASHNNMPPYQIVYMWKRIA